MHPSGAHLATTAVVATTAAGEEPLGGLSLAWLTFVLAATAVALVACGVMSARRTLHPNVVVGIRTTFTLDSARNWYAVHDRAAPAFTGSGLFYALSIVPLFLLDSVGSQVTGQMLLLGAGTAVLIVGTMRAQRAARRALAEEDEDGSEDPQ